MPASSRTSASLWAASAFSLAIRSASIGIVPARLAASPWRLGLRPIAIGAIIVAFGLAGCDADKVVGGGPAEATIDGGADGVGIGTDLDVSGAAVTTTPSGATTGPRVELTPTVLADGQIEVRVSMRDIGDLFGIAGHLRYDAAALELIASKAHPVLAGNGWEPRTLLHAKPGRLLLGAARVRVGGSPFSPLEGAKVGNQLWATLTFRKKTAGETQLSFDPAHALARAADYGVVPVQWQGLTIQGGGGQ